MNKIINDIINKKCSENEKKKELDTLSSEIEMAKGILSGKFLYCPSCNDYYLSKSYLTDSEIKDEKICIYQDPINSGGNDYADGYVKIVYSICPKGHKREINREERVKP